YRRICESAGKVRFGCACNGTDRSRRESVAGADDAFSRPLSVRFASHGWRGSENHRRNTSRRVHALSRQRSETVIPASLAGTALAVMVALGPSLDPDPLRISEQQKSSMVRPLVRHATECIARRVAADRRYQGVATDLGDLIIDAMPECIESIRAMVDGYDQYFGDGSGAAFFMGPYLNGLPEAVNGLMRQLDVP